MRRRRKNRVLSSAQILRRVGKWYFCTSVFGGIDDDHHDKLFSRTIDDGVGIWPTNNTRNTVVVLVSTVTSWPIKCFQQRYAAVEVALSVSRMTFRVCCCFRFIPTVLHCCCFHYHACHSKDTPTTKTSS